MNPKQKSFIFYDDDMKCIKHLSDVQAGQLFKAIYKFRLKGEAPDFDDDVALKILFHQITTHIAINDEKYRQSCERNALAARKRWENTTKQKSAYASGCMQTHANGCYNDNENDNDNDNVNDIDNENVAAAAPITTDAMLAKYRKIIAERASQKNTTS